MSDQQECSVCLELIKADSNKVITECGHTFHCSCLMAHTAHNDFSCPNCRAKLTPIPVRATVATPARVVDLTTDTTAQIPYYPMGINCTYYSDSDFAAARERFDSDFAAARERSIASIVAFEAEKSRKRAKSDFAARERSIASRAAFKAEKSRKSAASEAEKWRNRAIAASNRATNKATYALTIFENGSMKAAERAYNSFKAAAVAATIAQERADRATAFAECNIN